MLVERVDVAHTHYLSSAHLVDTKCSDAATCLSVVDVMCSMKPCRQKKVVGLKDLMSLIVSLCQVKYYSLFDLICSIFKYLKFEYLTNFKVSK